MRGGIQQERAAGKDRFVSPAAPVPVKEDSRLWPEIRRRQAYLAAGFEGFAAGFAALSAGLVPLDAGATVWDRPVASV